MRSARAASVAASSSAASFAVLLFDLQAHGESPGRRITFGWRESNDAAAALRFVRARVPGEKVGAIGQSLGGAAALLGPHPLDCDALVLESVFPDIDAALGNRLRVAPGPIVGPLAAPVLVPLFDLLLPPILGVGPAGLRPADRIAAIRSPVLVASGTVDRFTPPEEARTLFANAPEPKQLWLVEGAAHVDLEAFGPDEYWRHVLPFLARTLR